MFQKNLSLKVIIAGKSFQRHWGNERSIFRKTDIQKSPHNTLWTQCPHPEKNISCLSQLYFLSFRWASPASLFDDTP